MGNIFAMAAAICESTEYQNIDYCRVLGLITYEEATRKINALPGVEVTPIIHGRWLYEDSDPMEMPCSECSYKVMRYNNTPYCPNCGAKMDKGD